jgi:hypothetical protein
MRDGKGTLCVAVTPPETDVACEYTFWPVYKGQAEDLTLTRATRNAPAALINFNKTVEEKNRCSDFNGRALTAVCDLSPANPVSCVQLKLCAAFIISSPRKLLQHEGSGITGLPPQPCRGSRSNCSDTTAHHVRLRFHGADYEECRLLG